MIDLLRSLFESYSFDQAMVEQFLNEFEQIILLSLLACSQNRLSEGTQKLIFSKLESQDYDSTLKLIAAQYSQAEWDEVIQKEIKPLIQSYHKEVLLVLK